MGQTYRKCCAESALHIPVTIESEAGNAEPVLSMAKLYSVERDKADAERLACALVRRSYQFTTDGASNFSRRSREENAVDLRIDSFCGPKLLY
jgi:hypothetical protein